MKNPKFLLVYDPKKPAPFVIYEQAEIGGQVGQRYYSSHFEYKFALQELTTLNDGEPVLLAYSTKPIDNTFQV